MENLIKKLNCYIQSTSLDNWYLCDKIKCEDCKYYQTEFTGMNSTAKEVISRIEFLKKKNKNLKRNLQRIRKKVYNV